MTLTPGSRLGSNEITAKLGEGGMGEVYRATDVRLKREVAIKVLPAAFTADRDRLVRFEREAQLLASLNHPNIAHVYGFESAALADGSTGHFLAMELVEGEDLAERLKRGAIPVDESIAIARQMAEALEEAHERGIVHRDLKPANVKVTPDGKVKVLDFGLAKAMDPAGTSSADAMKSPTLTAQATQMGMIIGTAAYMAPEQARGKPVDKRADIWAFGAVLFEMLTGIRIFQGETVSDIIAATLRQEIDWSALPPSTPARVRQLLRRCLERDPKQRLRDIGEVRMVLDEASSRADAPDSGPAPLPTARKSTASTWAALALVAVASAAAGIWLWTLLRPVPSQAVTRLTIPLPSGQVLSGNGGPTISRDGRAIAYSARDGSGVSRLYVRALDRFDTSTIPESEGGHSPFFSPDGTRIGFFARGKLLTVAVAGGVPTPIADASALPMGGAWGDDDTIVFAPALSVGLLRVPASGGKPQQLTEPDEGAKGYAHGRPQFVAGSRSVLFTIWGASTGDVRGNAVVSLETGKWTKVTSSGMSTARFARSGHLLLSGPRGIRAAAFDDNRPQPANPQTFVVDEVFSTVAWSDSWFSVSDTGTLVYVPGDVTLGRLAWIERDGRASPLSDQPLSLVDPSLSPDGQRIAMQDRDENLWTMDLRRGTRVRLTLDGEGASAYPVFSRDGARVVFASNRSGDWEIYSVPVGGGSTTRVLTRKGNQFPLSFAPDGTLLFNERFRGRTGDLWTLAPDGAVAPFLTGQPTSKAGGQFSPDGRAVAYISDETGRDEIYVRTFDAKGDAVQVSTDGGTDPQWSPDGRELFYRHGDAFMAASVSSSDGRITVADSRKLFEARAAPGRSTLHAAYSVSPDGRRFLVFLQDPRAIPTQINVVQNWFEELKAKVPVR